MNTVVITPSLRIAALLAIFLEALLYVCNVFFFPHGVIKDIFLMFYTKKWIQLTYAYSYECVQFSHKVDKNYYVKTR